MAERKKVAEPAPLKEAGVPADQVKAVSDEQVKEGGAAFHDVETKSVGIPNSAHQRELAEDLPEKDEVQVAYKEAILADSAQAEAKAKAKAVEASPNADQTPSGKALLEVTGIANDTKRGEEYLKEKKAARWGYS